MESLDRPEWWLAVAVAIGLLIGAERERRQVEEKTQHQAAGVRTFALTALLGGVLVQIDQPGVVIGGLVVIAALVLIAFAFGDHTDPGMTSEVALLLTFGLGALAQRDPRLALSAGVVAARRVAHTGKWLGIGLRPVGSQLSQEDVHVGRKCMRDTSSARLPASQISLYAPIAHLDAPTRRAI